MVKEIFIFSCVIFSCALVTKGSITYQSDVYITNDPNTVQEEGNLYVSGDASVSSLNISDMIYMSQSPRPKFLAGADNSFGSLSRGMIFGGGNSVNTVNEYAFAFGAGNTVNAQNSIASGLGNSANYAQSFSFGEYCSTNANVSFAFGKNSETAAYYAVAMGKYVVSNSVSQFTVGQWNDPTIVPSSGLAADFYTWRPSDPIFVVGNGTGTEDRSNAFVVLKNGDAKVKGNLEAASIKISSPAGGIPMGEFGQTSSE